MSYVCKENLCSGCMVCVQKCSQNCISIVDSGDSLNAVINDDICVHCNACRNVCPQNILVKKQKPITWYQGWAEEEIRKRSSSGGAASAIMKAFIESGGFVASCLFDMGNFTFTLTNDIEVLKCFRGSKYVKSNPGNIYEKIADKLKNHKVLFVGLPCQVAALKRYVKCYENLYTIDLICHGTPSRKLLDSYLNEKGYSLNSCLDVTFRNQTMFGLSVNGDKVCPYEKDDYTIAFLKSVCYTESCYSCQYASDERVSDVTLGDSWGTELENEKANGISLILIQTEKGKRLIEQANLTIFDVDLSNAILTNPQLSHPVKMDKKRVIFFDAIKSGKSFSYAIYKIDRFTWLKKKIKLVLNYIN